MLGLWPSNSLFGSPEPEGGPGEFRACRCLAQPKPAREPIAAYASVVLDIPDACAVGAISPTVSPVPCQRGAIRTTVLAHFGNRAAAGYIVDIAPELGDLQGNNASTLRALSPSKPSSANRSLPPRLPVSRAG